MANDGDLLTSNVPIYSHAFNALNAPFAVNKNTRDIEETSEDVSSSLLNLVDKSRLGGPQLNGNSLGLNHSIGPRKKGNGSSSPISFDSACRKIHSKPKNHSSKINKKATRSLNNLGTRVDALPSYFSCIAPRPPRGRS